MKVNFYVRQWPSGPFVYANAEGAKQISGRLTGLHFFRRGKGDGANCVVVDTDEVFSIDDQSFDFEQDWPIRILDANTQWDAALEPCEKGFLLQDGAEGFQLYIDADVAHLEGPTYEKDGAIGADYDKFILGGAPYISQIWRYTGSHLGTFYRTVKSFKGEYDPLFQKYTTLRDRELPAVTRRAEFENIVRQMWELVQQMEQLQEKWKTYSCENYVAECEQADKEY